MSSSDINVVDFTNPGEVDPAEFGLDGLNSASARLAIDLFPTSGVGLSRLVSVRRLDASAVPLSGRVWFRASTPAGPGLVIADTVLALTVAETLMGGRGSVEARALTGVEERVLAPHLSRALGAIGTVLGTVGAGPLDVGDTGRGAPDLHGELLVVDSMVDIDMNGTSLGVLSVAVPAPARHVHHARRPDADSAPILASSLFQSIPLSIGVRTEEMPMPAAAVGAWAPGSVIELKHRVDTPLVAMVGNARLWSMTLGSNEGSLTAKILGRAPGPDSRPLLPGIPKTLPNPSASKGPSMSEISVEEAVQAASGALDGAGAPVAGAGESAPGAANPIALGPLGDVPVEVAVEIGRASVTLREAVTLGVGQVLTLDSEAGSPAAVLVNGQVVARGQVVIVDDFYGVRISELTNQ